MYLELVVVLWDDGVIVLGYVSDLVVCECVV